MKKILLIISLNLIVALSYAQTDNFNPLQGSPIQYKPAGVFRAEKFTINGFRVSRAQVTALLLNAPSSANETLEYRKNRRIALYAGGAGLLFIGAAAASTGSFNSTSYNNTPSKVFLGLTLGSLVTELVFGTKSYYQFKHAVVLYNEQFH